MLMFSLLQCRSLYQILSLTQHLLLVISHRLHQLVILYLYLVVAFRCLLALVGATPVYFGIEEAATPFEFNDHQSSSSSHYLEGQQALPVHTAPFYSPTESSSDSSLLSPFYPPNDAPFYPDMQSSLDLQSSPCYSDYQPLIPSFFADTSTISYTDSGTSSPSYYTDYSSPTSQPQSDTSLGKRYPPIFSWSLSLP